MAARLLVVAVATLFVASASGKGVIDPSLKKFFGGGRGGGGGEEGSDDSTENVLVSFQGLQSVFEKINAMNFSDDGERRTALTKAEKSFTKSAQGPLSTFLSTQGVNYESFWISNQMVVKNADPGLINAIASMPGVERVEKEPVVNINLPFIGEPEERNHSRYGRQASNEWGIETIRANLVWASYKGKGIVVANIDTGVRYTHETLRGRWRQEFGWFDPYSRSRTPNDGNGHGTHTMGTIAGTNGVGVAPEATWIACKGCDTDSCGSSELLECGQWIQCPGDYRNRNNDCSKAPHIVSNSWGGGGGSRWYDRVIESWQNSGIIPVVSIGNSGPSCSTAGSPGDRPKVIGVGSTERNERISSFSSLGPSSDGRIKPDISAPGGRVRSAWHTGDRTYNTISGTSMACPHVSGVVALMKQKSPSIKYDQIYNAITKTANKSKLDTSTARTCGGISGSTFPNNVFGHGRIDAVDSVNAV